MDQFESKNDPDTAKVKWKGFNDDGIPNVNKGSKTETADGQGYVSNPFNQNMIYDKTGSVEYSKKTATANPIYDKKPVALVKPSPRKKKSAAVVSSSGADFALAIIKRVVDFTVEISYSWDTGTDLDTTTQITSPISEGPVGWAHGSTTTHLDWSGDDTSSNGTETVDVNATLFFENHGVQDITVTMRGNWYAQAGTHVDLMARVLLADGSEKERVIWTAALTYEEQGGVGQPLGSIVIHPSGRVSRAS